MPRLRDRPVIGGRMLSNRGFTAGRSDRRQELQVGSYPYDPPLLSESTYRGALCTESNEHIAQGEIFSEARRRRRCGRDLAALFARDAQTDDAGSPARPPGYY